jgi:hypothetical protein
MKKWLTVTAIIALMLLVYAALGPYLTIHRIEKSIIQQDYEALSEQIDFPAVRADLKIQLRRKIEAETPEFFKNIPYAEKTVTSLSSAFLEQTIDPLMAGQLLYIMQGNHPDLDFGLSELLQPTTVPESTSTEAVFHDAKYQYIDQRTFIATVAHPETGTYRFTFKRHGLTWKLAAIELPMLAP